MRPPRQATLFDATPATASELLRIDKSREKLSPAQQAFNRLTAQIEQSRASLQRWEALAQRVRERVVEELMPQVAAVALAQRELATLIDRLLSPPPTGIRMSKRRRRGAVDYLLGMIGELLQAGPDEELEAIHDRHSDCSLADQREFEQAIELELAEAMLHDTLGADFVRDHGAQDAAELMRKAEEHLAEQRAAREQERSARKAKRAARNGSTQKQEQVAEERAQDAQAVSQSVREIYRKLVSSLHPDREPDPAERERKTVLMQRINGAYERRDLLTLLTLQMEVEQISAETIAGLPEKRLGHYNEVLREQLRALNLEIETLIAHLQSAVVDSGESRSPREPKAFENALASSIKEVRKAHQEIRATILALSDPATQKSQLDEIAGALDFSHQPSSEGFDFLDALDEAFAGGNPFEREASTSSRTKKRRRR